MRIVTKYHNLKWYETSGLSGTLPGHTEAMLKMTLTYIDETARNAPGNTTAQLEIKRSGGDDAYADYDVRLVDYAAKPHARVKETQIKGYPRSRGALVLLVQALAALDVRVVGMHRELSMHDARELSKGEVP